MKHILNIILLLVVSTQLSSCQNKKKMKTKFDWIESMSCPLGYPAEVYSGGLISQDGNYTSIYLGTGHGYWGQGGGGMRGGMKQIPERLEVVWISYAEDCIYEIDTEIDYDKMFKLFSEGYYVPSMSKDNPKPRKENYSEIIVGLAPGGVAVIWLNGLGRQIEIGRYQGKKTEIPQEEIAGLDDSNKLLFNKEWRQKVMKNPAIIPFELQKENENKPIPFGLWDSYRKIYSWSLNFKTPNNGVLDEVYSFFLNEEKYDLFGDSLIEKYPSIIPDNHKWNYEPYKYIPKRIKVIWTDSENTYIGNIIFDEKEIAQAFKEVFENGGGKDTQGELEIYINETKTFAAIKLSGNGKKVSIMKNKIKITH